MSSNMRIEKTCQVCGNSFIAKTTATKNCSDACAKRAYKLRKKFGEIPPPPTPSSNQKEEDPILLQEIQIKEFLSIKEASILIGASRWTLNRLINADKLKVTRLGRKIIIKRSDLDKIFNS
ncbi:excisionase family DNA-binding protein [Sediminitomix flava]|uniref:Excisionase family DNA binding protein n=1 Tax=Sediminitomix flava TaxID=379075 RepID=A0A315ZBS5_SEDFL|nr:excisionase family DNA-binding protein [Sediminitomix flava]PWJ42238.1 excisionase family DNA binding protein [Sediminitomix flava]